MFVGAFPQEAPSGDWFAPFSPAKPVDIDYSEDDVVNETVFRLKDLGDEIDGVISAQECDEMIAAVSAELP